MTISASSAEARARFTPSRSISSPAARRPAVSIKVSGTPSSSMATSMASRVVPARAETMAAARPANILRILDFPALGGPTSATRKPSRRRRPVSSDSAPDSSAWRAGRLSSAFCPMPPGRSSSANSKSASKCANRVFSPSRQPSARRRKPPRNCAKACFCCAPPSASIKSAMASAAVKSILPLSTARRVNSPASAARNPGKADKAASTLSTMASPPCKCSSAIASPVKLCGA